MKRQIVEFIHDHNKRVVWKTICKKITQNDFCICRNFEYFCICNNFEYFFICINFDIREAINKKITKNDFFIHDNVNFCHFYHFWTYDIWRNSIESQINVQKELLEIISKMSRDNFNKVNACSNVKSSINILRTTSK